MRRIEELSERCANGQFVTATCFLTPEERYKTEKRFKNSDDFNMVFFGGNEYCDRTICFFVPAYMDKDTAVDYSEYICAVHITARFANPSHRDYMGSVLGLGIERDRVGDIIALDGEGYLFCAPSVLGLILTLEKVGRAGVKVTQVELSDVPAMEKKMKNITFSVMSPRLDAVVSGMFGISRSEAARQIAKELVTVNYSPALKTDLTINEGDIISLKGKGKGVVLGSGGTSKKGRTYMEAGIYV